MLQETVWALSDIQHPLRQVSIISKVSIIRRFSHVTKSRIFKILDLRRKADRNFRGKL